LTKLPFLAFLMCSLSSRYTAVEYARQLKAFLYEYDQVEGGYSALLTGTVDAINYDARICCTIRKIRGKGRWQWLASHVPCWIAPSQCAAQTDQFCHCETQ
jgi:hypothetical protein